MSILLIGFLASLAAGAATGLGAVPLLLVRSVSKRVQNALLGFAAGVMLAASFFSLILPALETGAGPAVVGAGILLGATCLWALDLLIPHEHFVKGRQGPQADSLRRIWLFVIAITLHNIPKGWRSASASGPAIPRRVSRSPSASGFRTCRRDWRWRWPCMASATAGPRRWA